ncbi:MAG: universal stress protein [Steroidobacteraceae bacterium]|jgi:universal stress protein E|nr:universal stress protein [Steroidobacteraceae bacterium]
MQNVKRILVAIKDPGARALPAVRKAAQLAQAHGAELELFHSLSQTIMVDALQAQEIDLREYEREQVARTVARLETIAARLRRHRIEVSVAAEWDHPPSEAIVRRAIKRKVDLVVAERHAGKHVAGWMLSYTDWELLRLAPCPVLIVKTPRPYHRPTVMAAVDPLHQHAKPVRLDAEILKTAGSLKTAMKGTLQVVHVYPPPVVVTAGWVAGPVLMPGADGREAEARARAALASELERLPLPPHKVTVLEGVPREALPATARATRASIVVMGAVSRSGLKRLLIGNTAEAVLDALPCDVLIIKPGRFKSPVPARSRGAQLMAIPSQMTV